MYGAAVLGRFVFINRRMCPSVTKEGLLGEVLIQHVRNVSAEVYCMESTRHFV